MFKKTNKKQSKFNLFTTKAFTNVYNKLVKTKILNSSFISPQECDKERIE